MNDTENRNYCTRCNSKAKDNLSKFFRIAHSSWYINLQMFVRTTISRVTNSWLVETDKLEEKLDRENYKGILQSCILS